MLRRLLFVVLALSLPLQVAAQQSGPGDPAGNGPFGGLFGRTPERTGKEFSSIEFRASGGGQYDDALLFDETQPDGNRGGYNTGMNAGFAAGRHTTRSQFDLFGAVNYQEYLQDRPYGGTGYQGGGRVTVPLTDRVRFDAFGTFTRSPFFQVLPSILTGVTEWGEPLEPVSNPFAARLLENDVADGEIGVTHHYTKHSALLARVRTRMVRFRHSHDQEYNMSGFEGGWRHQLSRDLGVHISYRREDYQYRSELLQNYTQEYFDAGVDFNRAFSITRRTTVGFMTQTLLLHDTAARRFRLQGGANLTRLFKRTWHASLNVQRSTEIVPGFVKPLLSDMAMASMQGMFSKRVEWSATAGGGHGRFGFDDDGDPFRIATASSRLSVGLTRRLGAYLQYSYYHYDLPPATEGVSLLTNFQRQSVLAGLNLWIPIYQEVRAPRGPQ